MLLTALFAFVAAAVYNIVLAIHLTREKVSNILHEDYIFKKEVEFAVGISEMWNTRYFYTFSSFKGELLKMYHRIIINGLLFIFVLIHALMEESSAKLGIVVALLALFDIYVLLMRPYRCMLSNILLFMLNTAVLITAFLLMLKRSGLKSALFTDNYFYGLLIIVNALLWVIIASFFLLLIFTKRKWVTTKESVLKAIQGQDYVIFHIKKAKAFVRLLSFNE